MYYLVWGMINQLPIDVQENTKHFIQKVEERGMEKTKRKAVHNMLRKGFETPIICEVLDVSEEFVHDVRKEMSAE